MGRKLNQNVYQSQIKILSRTNKMTFTMHCKIIKISNTATAHEFSVELIILSKILP